MTSPRARPLVPVRNEVGSKNGGEQAEDDADQDLDNGALDHIETLLFATAAHRRLVRPALVHLRPNASRLQVTGILGWPEA
jgi:hypothetical protein